MKSFNQIKSFDPIKLLKQIYSKQKYLTLFIIVCVAIFIFTKISNMREGFEEGDNKVSSYIAPAGNTVLYEGKQNKKKCTKNNKKPNANDPIGIPRSEIPNGDEDLYILKSEVVPPVCPACPNVTVCPNGGDGNNNDGGNNYGNNKAPPPCPPCARCPEPAFECKKVPNYNSNNSDFLPRPVLADFSQFGM